jgi:hypothetical protein
VQVKVTAVNSSAASFLSVTPGGGSATSTVNIGPGLVVSNSVLVRLSGSSIRVFNAVGVTDFIIDVEGYFYDPD